MADWIDQLERLTEAVAGRIQDLTHEELLEFVEERGRLIEEAKRADSEAGASGTGSREPGVELRVRKLLAHDAEIRQRMTVLLQEHRGSVGKVQQAKRQKSAYDVEYTPDSLFFDKKK